MTDRPGQSSQPDPAGTVYRGLTNKSAIPFRLATLLSSVALSIGAAAIFWMETGSSHDRGQTPSSTPQSAVAEAALAPNLVRPLASQDAYAQNLSRPIEASAIEPQRPFKFPRGLDPLAETRATECLTQAIYYEAASEDARGQRAVAQVILNRVRSPLYPHSVCATVYQGSNLPTGCQFTFTCDGSLARKPSRSGWQRAQAVARAALSGVVEPSVGTATHYHTVFVVPYWAPSLQKIAMIGHHIFYRLPGRQGEHSAFFSAYELNETTNVDNPLAAAAAVVEQVEANSRAVVGASTSVYPSSTLEPRSSGELTARSQLLVPQADLDHGQLKIDTHGQPALMSDDNRLP